MQERGGAHCRGGEELTVGEVYDVMSLLIRYTQWS